MKKVLGNILTICFQIFSRKLKSSARCQFKKDTKSIKFYAAYRVKKILYFLKIQVKQHRFFCTMCGLIWTMSIEKRESFLDTQEKGSWEIDPKILQRSKSLTLRYHLNFLTLKFVTLIFNPQICDPNFDP